MSDYREKGIKVVDEMLDPQIGTWLKSLIGTGGFDGALAETAFDFAFGAAWARPGLTRAQPSYSASSSPRAPIRTSCASISAPR